MRGEQLIDDKSISFYNILKYDMIYLVMRFRNG